MASISDLDLLDRTARGDREAYGELVSRHQSAVCAISYSILGDVARSEDVAQEAFVAAWQRLGDLRDASRFKSWVCGIARNMALAALRRERKYQPLEAADLVAAAQPTSEDRAATREEQALVWKALESLPQRYREPLVLFYREELSVARVAEALELSSDTVKQRLSRGREMLREEITAKVEKVLRHTGPGAVFTLAVLGALPGIGAATASAAVGATSKIVPPLAAATWKAGGAAALLGVIDGFVAPVLNAWAGWYTWRYQRRRLQHEHGWEVELTCPKCGATALPTYRGLNPKCGFGLGKTPTIFASLDCSQCGAGLKDTAARKLVELFSDVRIPKRNWNVLAGLIALAVVTMVAFIFALLFPTYFTTAIAVSVATASLMPAYSMWCNWQIASLRHECECGKPSYKFMGLLGRSCCYRCSSCFRLLRLRD